MMGAQCLLTTQESAELMESLKVHGKGGDKYDNVRIGVNSLLNIATGSNTFVKLRASGAIRT